LFFFGKQIAFFYGDYLCRIWFRNMTSSVLTNMDIVPANDIFDVDPKVWGGAVWKVFHITAYAYPETPDSKIRQSTHDMFSAFLYILPCHKCRQGYRELWKVHDITQYLSSRAALIEWTVLLHNGVNAKLGLPPIDYKSYLNTIFGKDVFGPEEQEPNEITEHVEKKQDKKIRTQEKKHERKPKEREKKHRRDGPARRVQLPVLKKKFRTPALPVDCPDCGGSKELKPSIFQ
jgi:Erv1 / Alr family